MHYMQKQRMRGSNTMVDNSKLNHVQYKKKKVKKVKRVKTAEKVSCGTITCDCKLNIWQIIVKFIKNIFKR